jgi:glyoxylate reductase
MTKPRIFVSRLIPEKGLEMLREEADIEVWQDPLPPPYATLVQKVRGMDGLLCLLSPIRLTGT